MSAKRLTLAHGIAALAVIVASSGTAHAQCYSATQPGRELRQFSRNIQGALVPGKSLLNPNASSVVFKLNCQPIPGAAGLMTRQVNYGQLTIDFSAMTDCDELPKLTGTLRGDYFSLMRVTDPIGNKFPNERIGRHNARGNVYDPSGALIGTFTMQGTISTNTQRPQSIFGVGPCYWCLHHEGLLTIKLMQTPYFVGAGSVTATYAFDTMDTSAPCDTDPCKFDMQFKGTLDGIAEAACGTIKM